MTKPVALCLWLSLVPAASAQAWLDSPRDLELSTLSSAPFVRAVGDLDADGDPDLLVMCVSPGPAGCTYSQVLLNQGQGEFAAGPTTPTTTDYQFIGRPLVGDLTGDGLADLAYPTYALTTFMGFESVYRAVRVDRGLGGGTFGFLDQKGTGMTVANIALGDSNADGRLDLADVRGFVSVLGNELRWHRYDDSGWVGSSPLLATPGSLFGLMNRLVALDADQDGDSDLAGGRNGPSGVVVAFTVGGAPASWIEISIVPGAEGGHYAHAGDVDGDGDADLLATSHTSSPSTLRVALLDNDGTGFFTAGAPQLLSDPSEAYDAEGFELADWDGDGDLDLVGQNVSDLSGPPDAGPVAFVFANDGAGEFALAAQFPTVVLGTPAGIADLDANGAPDLVTSHAIKFGDETLHSVFAGASAGNSLGGGLADWEGDGDPDFFAADGLVRVNDATGAFATASGVWPAPAPPGPAGYYYQSTAAVGDFTGDGLLDYLAERWVNPGVFQPQVFIDMRLLADDGGGTYVDQGFATATAGTHIVPSPFLRFALFPSAVDLDGDADLDVLASNGYWPNDGAEFFPALAAAYAGDPLDAADFDADGDIDLLVFRQGPAAVYLERNGGGAAFTEELLLADPNVYNAAQFVDLDQDGDRDVAVGRFAIGASIHLFENQGGLLQPPLALATAQQPGARFLVDDLDGDLLGDLIVVPSETYATNDGDRALVFRRTGPGLAYEAPRAYLASKHWSAGDLDLDGDRDVIGVASLFSWRFHGSDAGSIRQYGAGSPGSGGVVPVLGASGPARVGSSTHALRLRRSLAGTVSLLALSTGEGHVPDFPFPGMTTLIDLAGYQALLVKHVPGPVAPAKGAWNIPVTIHPSMAGISSYKQVFAFDPGAPFQFSASNGLEVRYGP